MLVVLSRLYPSCTFSQINKHKWSIEVLPEREIFDERDKRAMVLAAHNLNAHKYHCNVLR